MGYLRLRRIDHTMIFDGVKVLGFVKGHGRPLQILVGEDLLLKLRWVLGCSMEWFCFCVCLFCGGGRGKCVGESSYVFGSHGKR